MNKKSERFAYDVSHCIVSMVLCRFAWVISICVFYWGNGALGRVCVLCVCFHSICRLLFIRQHLFCITPHSHSMHCIFRTTFLSYRNSNTIHLVRRRPKLIPNCWDNIHCDCDRIEFEIEFRCCESSLMDSHRASHPLLIVLHTFEDSFFIHWWCLFDSEMGTRNSKVEIWLSFWHDAIVLDPWPSTTRIRFTGFIPKPKRT